MAQEYNFCFVYCKCGMCCTINSLYQSIPKIGIFSNPVARFCLLIGIIFIIISLCVTFGLYLLIQNRF